MKRRESVWECWRWRGDAKEGKLVRQRRGETSVGCVEETSRGAGEGGRGRGCVEWSAWGMRRSARQRHRRLWCRCPLQPLLFVSLLLSPFLLLRRHHHHHHERGMDWEENTEGVQGDEWISW